MSDRLLRFATSVMDRKVSRRSVLVKTAIVGSALAVGPIRYLTRPLSAEATIRCSNCSPGALCCDGWTAMCCQLNPGGGNYCPPGTYRGGWWKCTNYRGTQLCNAENMRYIVDCNLIPGTSCADGCHCANNDCANRGLRAPGEKPLFVSAASRSASPRSAYCATVWRARSTSMARSGGS